MFYPQQLTAIRNGETEKIAPPRSYTTPLDRVETTRWQGAGRWPVDRQTDRQTKRRAESRVHRFHSMQDTYITQH